MKVKAGFAKTTFRVFLSDYKRGCTELKKEGTFIFELRKWIKLASLDAYAFDCLSFIDGLIRVQAQDKQPMGAWEKTFEGEGNALR